MSHSSSPDPSRPMAVFLQQFRDRAQMEDDKSGKRSWPDGRIDATDDGLCRIGVSEHKGRVILAFDRPMDWVGMTPEQARELAESLQIRANEAKGIR